MAARRGAVLSSQEDGNAPPSLDQVRSVALMSLRLGGWRRPSRRTGDRCAHILAAVHLAVAIGIPAAIHLAVAHGLTTLRHVTGHLVALVRLRLGRRSG